MLTEHFIASVGVPIKPPGTNVAKDAAIFIHEHRPLNAQRAIFKKSATAPNCLAVSDSHLFAAQAEKAVVHVYSREKGNQEAIVPFTERITCIALACDDTVLILGTAEGRIFLWETLTGRQVTTAQSHLQDVTSLATDPTSNFLLSASADSTIHTWSIPSLLSFSGAGIEPSSPIRTFSSHRSGNNALVLGHSSSFCNIAISASKDRTCLVWDYHTGNLLRTYLLPFVPTCISLDAADRIIYVGYEDGSIQQLSLFASADGKRIASGFRDTKDSSAPIQPPQSSRWTAVGNSVGAALSLSVSYDSSVVLSGHEFGVILLWDTARGGAATSVLQVPLPGPVTNLMFLPVSGFANESRKKLKTAAITKPRYGAFDSASGTVPNNYTLNVEFVSKSSNKPRSDFEDALMAPSFPSAMLDEGLNELLSWGKDGHSMRIAAQDESEDFMALDDQPTQPRQLSLEEQNASLRAELEALRRLQKASFDKIDRINAERKALIHREQKRVARNGVNGTSQSVAELDADSSSEDD